MKLKLHHLNLTTRNVDAMDAFYRGVLDMDDAAGRISLRSFL